MANTLYVGNLNYDTTNEALRAFMSQAGEVQDVRILTDQYTGRSRGFGFVDMATPEGVEKAVQELNGKELDGRTLKIDKARPRGSSGPRQSGSMDRW
ncbi:MAG: RNA-binding protein [Anaerolineae bacterium]|nr:RNA-binding protein [Anaerolineae bacterium]